MTKRVDFVKKIQELLLETDCKDVVVRYGYVDHTQTNRLGYNGVFVEVDYDINTDPNRTEVVLVKYKEQHDVFGRIQSIEGDGIFWILKDIVNAVDKL